MKKMRLTRVIASVAVATIVAVLSLTPTSPVKAAGGAKVSFTFDDGYYSALSQAAPTLQASGYTGTAYITTSFVGKKTYLTWSQISKLATTYGWEIGSHSVTHPLMSTLSQSQMNYEAQYSKQVLASHGFNATSFATPYGDYNNTVLATIAKYYTSHRGFKDGRDQNFWPYSDYYLQVRQVQADTTLAQAQSYVDEAAANGTWLILVFHDITNGTPTGYQFNKANLASLASYARSQGLANTTVTAGLATGANMFSDGNFQNGLGSWTTDDPLGITRVTTWHGSMPESYSSLRLVAKATDTHLFSPKVAVTPGTLYGIKGFVNVARINTGELAYYIDEYDAAGNWISGQYKVAERSSFVESLNVGYIPSSNSVAQASLQVIVTGGSGITAYFDSAQFFVAN